MATGTAWKTVPLWLCNSRAKPSCRPGGKGGHGHVHLPGPGATEVMGTMGVYQGHGAPVRGLGSSSHPAKAASVGAELALGFGSPMRSSGGPLHRALRLQDGHLRDAITFLQSPCAPSTEANWRTGCLRKKNRKKPHQG